LQRQRNPKAKLATATPRITMMSAQSNINRNQKQCKHANAIVATFWAEWLRWPCCVVVADAALAVAVAVAVADVVAVAVAVAGAD